MKEVPVLMTQKEFELHLKETKEELDKNTPEFKEYRTFWLIGRVTSETSPVYTPEQLKKIFDLA